MQIVKNKKKQMNRWTYNRKRGANNRECEKKEVNRRRRRVSSTQVFRKDGP